MPSKVFIHRSHENEEITVDLDGGLAHIRVKITGRLATRERRAIALTFLRQMRPWLEHFRFAVIHNVNSPRHNFSRDYERGVNLFRSRGIDTPEGKLGFEIRMRRLKFGLTQAELASRVGIQRSHLSDIERGMAFPRKATRTRIENELLLSFA